MKMKNSFSADHLAIASNSANLTMKNKKTMNKARTGKIARLPKDIRDDLDLRLDNGQLGPELLAWLNAQPEVRQVLQEQFGGRPITQQNLSEWRHGGHQDWLQRQEAREVASRLLEQSETLSEASPNRSISDQLATLLSVEIYRFSKSLLNSEGSPEQKWRRVCAVHQQISRLRRDDQRADWMNLASEQLAHKRGGAPLNPVELHRLLTTCDQTPDPKKQN
jgi:hypothetical protein